MPKSNNKNGSLKLIKRTLKNDAEFWANCLLGYLALGNMAYSLPADDCLFYALLTNIFGALVVLAACLVPVPMGFMLWQRQSFLLWEIYLNRGDSKKRNIKNSKKKIEEDISL